MVREATCSECGVRVAECDNGVLLDIPAVAYEEPHAVWTIMQLGSTSLASVGAPGTDGTAHTIHEHQPAEAA